MAANPSIQLGTDGNWAIKEDNLLAYKKDGTRFFNKEFDFTRGSLATFVDKDGLIKYSGVTDTELVTNGDFATDSYWSTPPGWEIIDGKLKGTNVNAVSATQGGYTFLNKSFKVVYTISDYVQGDVRIYLGGTQPTPNRSADGTYTEYINITIANTTLYIQGINNFTGSITNISVKEIQTDVPRIDFTDDATGHLLLEPQSTNLYAYSEYFSQSVWNKLNCNVTLTSEVAPNGNANSVYNLTGTSANLYTGGSANIEHTISFYIKSNNQGKDSFKLRLGNNTSVEYTATNEWVRYEFTSTPTTSVFGITTTSAPNNEFDLLIWGAQSEALSYATSYIPTYGSSATRNADVCNNSGSAQDFNSEEGVLYAEINQDNDYFNTISICDGSTSNRVTLALTDEDIRVIFVYGGVVVQIISNSNTQGEYHKVAIRYTASNVNLFIDGVLDSSASIGAFSSDLDTLEFAQGNGGNNFYGKTKNLKVFKRAMSDSELYLLTVTQYQSYQEMATALNYTL